MIERLLGSGLTRLETVTEIRLRFRSGDAWEQDADVAILGSRSPLCDKLYRATRNQFRSIVWQHLDSAGVHRRQPGMFSPEFVGLIGKPLCECELLCSDSQSVPWANTVRVKHTSRPFVNRQTVGRLSGILAATHTLFRPKTVVLLPLSWRNPRQEALTLLASLLQYRACRWVPGGVAGQRPDPDPQPEYVICDAGDLSEFNEIAAADFAPVFDWLRWSMRNYKGLDWGPYEARGVRFRVVPESQ